MSSGMMDTEPGGESTQYESIKTVTNPSSKSGGQMGTPETSVDSVPSVDAAAKAERGAKTAENIRYGQAISEHGMGGQTTTTGDSSADQGSGFGGTEETTQSSTEESEILEKDRQEQAQGKEGYEMDEEIGG